MGFSLIGGYPLFDSFYFTLSTMTTVGYGDSFTRGTRVFNAFLIMFGVSTIFIAIGAMTQTIIEFELGDLIGKRRNKRMIEKLKDHYIICGFGRVGRGAAAELQASGCAFRGGGQRAGTGGASHVERNAGCGRGRHAR